MLCEVRVEPPCAGDGLHGVGAWESWVQGYGSLAFSVLFAPERAA